MHAVAQHHCLLRSVHTTSSPGQARQGLAWGREHAWVMGMAWHTLMCQLLSSSHDDDTTHSTDLLRQIGQIGRECPVSPCCVLMVRRRIQPNGTQPSRMPSHFDMFVPLVQASYSSEPTPFPSVTSQCSTRTRAVCHNKEDYEKRTTHAHSSR